MFNTTGKFDRNPERKENTLKKLVRLNKTLNHEEADRSWEKT